MFETVAEHMGQFRHGHLKSLEPLLRRPAARGPVCLPDGVSAEERNGRLLVSRGRSAIEEAQKPLQVEVRVPGRTECPDHGFVLDTECLEGGHERLREFLKCKPPNEELCDLEKITFPLALRFRKRGDRFWPLGAPGERKLKDFLIDRKVPRDERDVIPLLASGDRVVWVAGYRIDERIKVDGRTTRLLRLRLVTSR